MTQSEINSATRTGLLVAGNWIQDQVKLIDEYPAEQSLANILYEYTSNGGSAYNIVINATQLGVAFPLEAIGLVGDDAIGMQILNNCQTRNIDTKQLRVFPEIPTSYTIVTSVKQSGKRTFFHHRGANSALDIEHFDLAASNAKIFHLGYLLLLDRLDEIRQAGRTNASRILENAKNNGMLTSIDLVSENSDRFRRVIPCSLPFVDYLFLNEFEASQLTETDLTAANSYEEMSSRCQQAFSSIFAIGVNEWVIIHCPQGVWAAHRDGTILQQPGLAMPKKQIIGTNGAGDALAAGVLLGVHEGWEMAKSLKLGVCAAASSLFSVTCSDSIMPYDQCLELPATFNYRTTW